MREPLTINLDNQQAANEHSPHPQILLANFSVLAFLCGFIALILHPPKFLFPQSNLFLNLSLRHPAFRSSPILTTPTTAESCGGIRIRSLARSRIFLLCPKSIPFRTV